MTITYHPAGFHLIADLYEVATELLNNPQQIEQIMLESADVAGATVLSSHFHHFGDKQGVTGVVLLAESHISIHTWPEHQFAAVDIFMCGSGKPDLALAHMKHKLMAKRATTQSVARGST